MNYLKIKLLIQLYYNSILELKEEDMKKKINLVEENLLNLLLQLLV